MKALIISDIHGNLEYARKIDKICEKEKSYDSQIKSRIQTISTTE